MRLRRPFAVFLGLVVVLLATFVLLTLFWVPTGRLVELTFVKAEDVEPDGKRVIFRIKNLTSQPLDFDNRQTFEEKGAGLSQVERPSFRDTDLLPHQEREFYILMDRNTKACRFVLNCRLPTPSERTFLFLQDHGLRRRFPALSRWLIDHVPRKITWRKVTSEVALPTASKRVLTESKTAKYKMDGSFDDWKDYRTAWSEKSTKPVQSVVVEVPNTEITECDYTTDANYLYLFLKVNPRMEAGRFAGKLSGSIGHLFIGRNNDGELKVDDIISKSETRIYIPFGTYSSTFAGKDTQGCFVRYEIERRDSTTRDFAIKVRDESSRTEPTLIALGKDGIEIALLLSDLGKASGSKFPIVCIDAGFLEFEHKILVNIRSDN